MPRVRRFDARSNKRRDPVTSSTGEQSITYGQAVGVIGAEAMASGVDQATPGFLSHLFSDGISLRDAKNIVVGGFGGLLARIIHIFEDNKSLLCYKHVD